MDTMDFMNTIDEAILSLGLLGESAKAARDEITKQAIAQEYYYGAKKTNDLFEIEKSVFLSSEKSSNLSTADRLSWWKEMLDKYSGDYRVILKCNEEIFSLTRELVDSINSVSFTYIDERAYFNDWAEYEDDAVSSFIRIKEKNREFLDKSIITYNEYCSNVKLAGSKLYDGRIDQSRRWLEHQRKYNGLSLEDYIAGLNRMAEYTEEYYNAGLITYREYAHGLESINEDIIDKTRELNRQIYTDWQTSADNWKKQRDTYGDWELYGDSEVEYYKRCIDRISELYKNGTIQWQEYSDATMEYNMLLFKAWESQYDNWLSDEADYISRRRDEFSKEEQTLRDSWSVEDREADKEDIRAQMEIYRHSVTKAGQDKYEDLKNQLKTLEREEQMYQLEQEHQNTLDNLEAEYERYEENKNRILWSLRDTNGDVLGKCVKISDLNSDILKACSDIGNTGINVYGLCEKIQSSSTQYQQSIVELIKETIWAIKSMQIKVTNTTNTTNTTTSKTTTEDGKQRYEIAHGYYG